MDTFVFILRMVFLVFGSFLSVFYLLLQCYQKIPAERFRFLTVDIIIYSVVSLAFGFGTNSYIALAAFLPLLLCKFLGKKIISSKKLRGSGQWMEIDWKKLNPKGFERHVPHHVLEEMKRMIQSAPKDSHFIVPRLYVRLAIYFILRKTKKEANKKNMTLSPEQQAAGLEQLVRFSQVVLELEQGKTEKKDFNIGLLKVTRL